MFWWWICLDLVLKISLTSAVGNSLWSQFLCLLIRWWVPSNFPFSVLVLIFQKYYLFMLLCPFFSQDQPCRVCSLKIISSSRYQARQLSYGIGKACKSGLDMKYMFSFIYIYIDRYISSLTVFFFQEIHIKIVLFTCT